MRHKWRLIAQNAVHREDAKFAKEKIETGFETGCLGFLAAGLLPRLDEGPDVAR